MIRRLDSAGLGAPAEPDPPPGLVGLLARAMIVASAFVVVALAVLLGAAVLGIAVRIFVILAGL